MRHTLVLLFLSLATVGVVLAQDYPRAEVFGGYSYLRIDTQGVSGSTLDTDCNLLFGSGTCPPGTFHVHTGFNGWNGAVQVNANRWLGVKADFSGHYGTPITLSANAQAFLDDLGITGFPPKANSYSYLFGPVMSQRFDRYSAFGHALFGVNRIGTNIGSQNVGSFLIPGITLSDSAFAMAFGGGVDVKIAPHFSLRGQADYLYTGRDLSGGVHGIASHQNNVRASVGVVYSFGGGSRVSRAPSQTPTPPTAGMSLSALGVMVAERRSHGAEITDLAQNGVAASAGLRAGDVINSVDSTPVTTPMELAAELAKHSAGDKIKLGYMIRGQWQAETTIVLGNH